MNIYKYMDALYICRHMDTGTHKCVLCTHAQNVYMWICTDICIRLHIYMCSYMLLVCICVHIYTCVCKHIAAFTLSFSITSKIIRTSGPFCGSLQSGGRMSQLPSIHRTIALKAHVLGTLSAPDRPGQWLNRQNRCSASAHRQEAQTSGPRLYCLRVCSLGTQGK